MLLCSYLNKKKLLKLQLFAEACSIKLNKHKMFQNVHSVLAIHQFNKHKNVSFIKSSEHNKKFVKVVRKLSNKKSLNY